MHANACVSPAASGRQTSSKKISPSGHLPFCDRALDSGLFFLFLFSVFCFSFPRGQAFPLADVSRKRREARDTIILPFFHQRKIDLRAERKSLERGHLTCLTSLSCSNFQWEANGLGGGLSGCTHYSRVSTARAEAGL